MKRPENKKNRTKCLVGALFVLGSVILFAGQVFAGGPLLRKYDAATTINFQLHEADGIDFRVDAAHASGDTKIMKAEGDEANTASGFVDEGTGYSLALSATEMQAARIVIYVVDQTATKAWLDTAIVIETYGNASAQHAFDLDEASNNISTADVNAQVVDVINTDTSGEPSQGAPPATTSLRTKIDYMYKFTRNETTNDGSNVEVYNDAGDTVDHKAPVSEAAGTVTRGEFISGP